MYEKVITFSFAVPNNDIAVTETGKGKHATENIDWMFSRTLALISTAYKEFLCLNIDNTFIDFKISFTFL